MDDHRRQLARGFNWLGGATVIAKVIDFSTILVMLLYLTKQQVGVASLVISVGMVVEGLNGLGTSEALIQSRSVSRLQLDSLFWYIVGAALLVGALTLLAAPWIAAIYGVGGMAAYFLAVAVKQPLVGAALIPLALMNRDLQYERIAVVNVCATLAAALTRLALGALGAGAWALVAGYAASGLYVLLGASVVRPFRPRPRCSIPAILPLMRFGVGAGTANVAEQMFKNIDYLLIGWFYGAAQLAIYRVAFDIAMEPAMAIGTLINRTALPVFARVSAVKADLGRTLNWSLHRIAMLVAPLTAGLMLAAGPLTSLIRDHQGNSYGAAALPLRVLAIAALLRVTTMLLATVMIGSGRPGTAARLSATTLLLLAASILVVGFSFPARSGLVAVSAIWLGLYPLVLAWGARYLRRHWEVRIRDLARAFAAPLAGIGVMILIVSAARHLVPGAGPRLQVGLVVLTTALLYASLFLQGRAGRRRES